MAEMTPKLAALITTHLPGREKDVCWQHPKKGTWIIYHWALALIARANGVEFGEPEVLELGGPDTKTGSFKDPHPRTITLKVSGRMGMREAWAFGEVSPNNNTNAYPYAMALKRGQDIVALDLLDLRGEVYSEEEADEFKLGPTPESAKGAPSAEYMEFRDAADAAAQETGTAKLATLWREVTVAAKAGKLTAAEKDDLQKYMRNLA